MNGIFSTLLFLVLALNTEAQITITGDNICHDKAKYLKCFNWLDYKMKFSETTMTSFSNQNNSIQYDALTNRLKLFQRDDTLTIQLKDNGVELHSYRNDSTKFINLIDQELVMLFSMAHVNIMPMYDKGKIFGLPIPVIDNGLVVLYFYFGLDNKKLYWDIIVEGQSRNNNNPQVKIFSDAFGGQIETINMCYRNGSGLTYKEESPGIGISYVHRKEGYVLWKIRKVLETKYQGLLAYSDIVEYDKKGKLKSSTLDLKDCDCK